MSDGPRNLDEIGRTVDRHETQFELYVRKDVYQAERDAALARVTRIEQDDTSKASGTRNWLYGLAQTAFGALLGIAGAYLMSRGH